MRRGGAAKNGPWHQPQDSTCTVPYTLMFSHANVNSHTHTGPQMGKGGGERTLWVQIKQIWRNSFLFIQVGTSWSSERRLFAQENPSGKQYEALDLSLDSAMLECVLWLQFSKHLIKIFYKVRKCFESEKLFQQLCFLSWLPVDDEGPALASKAGRSLSATPHLTEYYSWNTSVYLKSYVNALSHLLWLCSLWEKSLLLPSNWLLKPG